VSDPTTDTPQERVERFRQDVASWRKRYVVGTPEKYPKSLARVRVLDAEAVLTERRQVEERLRPVIEEANQTLGSLSGEVDWENAFIQLVEKIEAAAGSREPQ
jgi:hypothetical protein